MVKIIPRPRRPLPERPVLIQSEELVLEGLYINRKREGRATPVLLNAPHPQFGGSMDSPVINEIAYALSREKVSSLRFNYRGCGGSQGVYEGGPGEMLDVAAASKFLLETYYEEAEFRKESKKGVVINAPFSIAGFSFGSWVGFNNALKKTYPHKNLERLLLVAPPLEKPEYDYSNLPKLKMEVGILVGERDTFCKIKTLENFLQQLEKKHPKWRRPQTYFVKNASHFFVQGLSEAGEAAAQFLTKGRF